MGHLTIHAMPGFERSANGLAETLGAPCHSVEVRHFPDRESLVTVHPTGSVAAIFCSLDRPNEKLIELMLAAAALHDRGASRLILIAPYMCYMRQDIAFAPGQAVSQTVVGRFLSELFDKIITVDPHLHRQKNFADVFPGTEAIALSAAALLAAFLGEKGDERPDGTGTVLVGPDEESRQWVEAVAAPLGLDVLVARKTRRGDRDVDIVVPDAELVTGRPVILVDDVISSGVTLARCAELLNAAGAIRIDALAVHGLFDEVALAMIRQSGIRSVRTTDSVPHPTNAIELTPLLADAMKDEIVA